MRARAREVFVQLDFLSETKYLAERRRFLDCWRDSESHQPGLRLATMQSESSREEPVGIIGDRLSRGTDARERTAVNIYQEFSQGNAVDKKKS